MTPTFTAARCNTDVLPAALESGAARSSSARCLSSAARSHSPAWSNPQCDPVSQHHLHHVDESTSTAPHCL
jgi:hypothetical protein